MRWRRSLALAVLAALVLAACTGIPDDGPVTTARGDDGQARTTVRYSPAGPRVGASPEEIVRGYLDAMLAYPVTTATASEFLTPGAARSWRASRRTVVYGAHEVSQVSARPDEVDRTQDGTGAIVRLTASTRAVLGPTGRYGRGDDLDERLRLVKVKGQWRITDPPSGTLVSSRFFDDYYRAFDVFFFDRPGQRLVPRVVHLPIGGQLPTALVAALAAGPDDDRFLRTYVPSRSSLRPSVPVADRVADVAFTVELGGRTAGDLDRLAAQVVWTLRQVPDLDGVRITGGSPVLSPNGEPVNDLSDWGRFGPSGGSPVAYALAGDRLRQVDGDSAEPVDGPWGRDAAGASRVAVGDRDAAGIVDQGGAVRVQGLQGGTVRRLPAVAASALTWDGQRMLWVADRPGGTRLRVGPPARLRTLEVPGLDQVVVTSLAVSPDGGHVVVTGRRDGRTELLLAPVARDRAGEVTRVGDLRRLAPSVSTVRSGGWLDASVVELLGTTRLGLQVRRVSIDGSGLTSGVAGGVSLLPDVGPRLLARGSAVDPPRWVLDDRGRLWHQPPGDTWRVLRTRDVVDLSTSP
ncbi:MAG: LpqB family beta-propeller domain-containing protein [Aeromicrobium erythreum]